MPDTPPIKYYSLGEKQQIFTRFVSKLIEWAYGQGFQLTFGEAWRDPRVAKLNAQSGAGIAKSLHCSRLAIDLNLFKAGKFLSNSEDHKPLGEFWKTCSTPGINCCWGGDFKSNPDGNHYSIEHNGVK